MSIEKEMGAHTIRIKCSIVQFLFFMAPSLYCRVLGILSLFLYSTMRSQFSPMGYGINKKFLCKLDPEYNSNGSYDFCSTSLKKDRTSGDWRYRLETISNKKPFLLIMLPFFCKTYMVWTLCSEERSFYFWWWKKRPFYHWWYESMWICMLMECVDICGLFVHFTDHFADYLL